MFIKKIALIFIFLTFIGCHENDNKNLSSDQLISIKKDNLLQDEYERIVFPLDSIQGIMNGKFINLNEYKLNKNDMKLFYSGEESARILMTTVQKIGSKEYLLGLIVVNFNDYEGSGPAQVIFLSGGENLKNNYKNNIFILMGGKFPTSNNIKKIEEINEDDLKDYCIQSFKIKSDLSKEEELKCLGEEPMLEIKRYNFDIDEMKYYLI